MTRDTIGHGNILLPNQGRNIPDRSGIPSPNKITDSCSVKTRAPSQAEHVDHVSQKLRDAPYPIPVIEPAMEAASTSRTCFANPR